jgi:hypothetical protein
MDREKIAQEVSATYEADTRAFLANDMEAINSLVKYPIGFIRDDDVIVTDSFPIKPADLMREKQWHTSSDTDIEIVGISETKAHVLLPRVRRLRKDGKLIETASVFYAFTRTSAGWKIFAISSISVPA